MNAQLPATRPPIQAGGQVTALIPQNLDEAFRVAKAFHVSGLAPQSIKSAEAIMVAIMAGAELGFAPYQAMQSFAVINGRASIWGDAIPALLWARGFDIEEWFDDEDNATKAFCKVTRPSGKVIERTFSLKDAKLANLLGKQGPWQTAQKRMLQMRARAFAARDGAADVLRGMPVYEEVADYQQIRDVTPQTSGLAARLAHKPQAAEGFNPQQAAQDLGVEHDAETGEIIDAEIEDVANEEASAEEVAASDDGFPGDKDAPLVGETTKTDPPKLTIAQRAAMFEERMGAAPNSTKLKSIRRAADNLFDDMEQSAPEDRVELAFKYEARLEEMEAAEKAAAAAEASKGGAE